MKYLAIALENAAIVIDEERNIRWSSAGSGDHFKQAKVEAATLNDTQPDLKGAGLGHYDGPLNAAEVDKQTPLDREKFKDEFASTAKKAPRPTASKPRPQRK